MTTTTLDPHKRLTINQAEAITGFRELNEADMERQAEINYGQESQSQGMSAYGSLPVNEGPTSPADLSGMISLTDLPPAEIVKESPVLPEQLVNAMGAALTFAEKTTSFLTDTAVEAKGAVGDLVIKEIMGFEKPNPIKTPEDVKKQQAARINNENFFQHLKATPEEGDTVFVNGKPMRKEDALKLYGVIPSFEGITDGRGNVNAAATTAIENKQSDDSQEQREADRSQAFASATKSFMRQGEMEMGTENPQHFTRNAG